MTIFEWFNCFDLNLRILYHLLLNGNVTRQLQCFTPFFNLPRLRIKYRFHFQISMAAFQDLHLL